METGGSDDSSAIQQVSVDAFQQGQAFDPALVPANSENQTLLDNLNLYSQQTGFKVVVLNEDGDGLAQWTSDPLVSGQEEWSQVILERCQLRYENKPCAIFAEGDQIKYNESDFKISFIDQFVDIPPLFDENRLPGVIDYWKQNNSDYLNNPNNAFRAIAVNDVGTAHIGWTRTEQTGANSGTSQAEANRRAIEFCEAITYARRPCFLHTVGTGTIWDPANTQWEAARVKFAPSPVVGSEVPFITEQTRINRILPAISNFETNGGPHFMIVMGRFGRYANVFTSTTPVDDALRNQALSQCDTDYANVFGPDDQGFQERCFIYSEDMEIVMTPDSYGRAVHFWHPDNRGTSSVTGDPTDSDNSDQTSKRNNDSPGEF